MSALCQARGVKLLTYGVLAGGFLSERWLGAAEPAAVADWSQTNVQLAGTREHINTTSVGLKYRF